MAIATVFSDNYLLIALVVHLDGVPSFVSTLPSVSVWHFSSELQYGEELSACCKGATV